MWKVLLGEDEILIRQGILMTVNWASLDCMVVGEAENGEEGLKAVSDLDPDLIITDLRMPKMDGLEMLKKLREEGNRAAVIVLTAYDQFSYAQSALRLGVVDYLLKPFHDGELEEIILRIRKKHWEKKEKPLVFSEFKIEGMSRYISEATEYIEQESGNPDLTVGEIAEKLGISEGHLSHTFKKETGQTILSYITRCRIKKAALALKSGKYKVYEVAEMAGYRDITYFSTSFKKLMGISPSEYQSMSGK